MLRHGILLSASIAVALPLGAAGPGPAETPRPGVEIHLELPRDPLLVVAFRVDNLAEVSGGVLERLVGLNGGPTPLADLLDLVRADSATAPPEDGDDLLALVGPDVALSIDLAPLDEAATAFVYNDDLGPLLRGVGCVATVRDTRKATKALRRLTETHGLETVRAGDLVAVQLESPWSAVTLPPLYYGLKNGRLAVGFGREWVASFLAGHRAGQRLSDGADFARVASHVDPRPRSLTYLNLPKLQAMVAASQLMQNVMSGESEAGDFLERVFNQESMGVGLGVTSVVGADGMRTASFGPPWMTGPAVAGGLVAALAVPGWLHAADRGRARKTLSDIESIAAACEGFSADAHGYPGPTEGWVPVETIASHLEPVYIAMLPRVDAWQNPILYRSDGRSYRLISLGKDGRMDRDWSQTAEPEASAADEGDIVFADGRFLVLPGRLLER